MASTSTMADAAPAPAPRTAHPSLTWWLAAGLVGLTSTS